MKLLATTIFLILAIFTSTNLQGQSNNDYMDLLVLYVDGDYEKCLKKADKYMDKDETKKDPLPYLYTAMSFYEMSRDHKYVEDYPNAYRQCLSYLSRYRKKDKTYQFKKDAEPFIEKIKFEVAEQIDNYELGGTEKDYRKSKSLLKKLKKIDPEDIGVQILLGVHYIKAKDKSSGKAEIKEAFENIEEDYSDINFNEMTASQQYYFKEAMIAYYHYRSKNYPEEAKEFLFLGKQFYSPKNEEILIDNYGDYTKLVKEVEGES